MAVKTVATQTCDVCGDKVGDIQAIDAASVPSRGIRVQTVKVAGEGETVSDLYAFGDICDKCLGAVNTLFARLTKRNKARAEKGVKGKRAAKAAEKAVAVAAVAPVVEGEPKKKRGRPKKTVEVAPNTAPIRDSVLPPADAAEPEAHANGVAGAEATHPF